MFNELLTKAKRYYSNLAPHIKARESAAIISSLIKCIESFSDETKVIVFIINLKDGIDINNTFVVISDKRAVCLDEKHDFYKYLFQNTKDNYWVPIRLAEQIEIDYAINKLESHYLSNVS